MKSANGVLVLILGILSFTGFGCLTGIPAWIMGNISLKEIDAGVADPSERTFVQVGRILGMVATLLMVLIGCAYLAFVAGIIGLVAIGGSSAR